jgi:hypothetical protein
MAYYKLLVLPPALDSAFKRDLAGVRVINFLAIAWIATNLARYGFVRSIAARLPWIGAVGRAGMTVFIAGAVISLTVDSVLFTLTDGLINVPAGIAADCIAVGLLLAVPHVRQPVMNWMTARTRASVAAAVAAENRTRSVR